jgi:hypothetical protein
MKKKSGSNYFLFLLLFAISPCSIAAVTIINNLDFGTIAVVNNTTTSDLTININNSITLTNHIRVLTPGQRGEYLLSSYPAYTQLFTTVSVLQAQTSSPAPGSEQFTLVEVTTASSVTTSNSGTATVLVGGTFRTSGASGHYNDTPYTATLQLNVNY